MSKIWLCLMIIAMGIITFLNPSLALTSFSSAGDTVVKLCISLVGIYAIWLGFIQILEETGLSNKIAKILSPIINFLFDKPNKEAKKQLAINISSNLLGLGNAATPSGIKAMEQMQDGSDKATYPMIMLMVINSASIQLLPTTVIGLRAAAGSSSAGDIILPTLLTSFISLLLGIILVKLLTFLHKKRTLKKVLK